MKKIIQLDTFKCCLIGQTLFLSYRFSRGRQYYLRYLSAILQGTMFGSFYSIHYSNKKLMDY
jgi:hypothetical protein